MEANQDGAIGDIHARIVVNMLARDACLNIEREIVRLQELDAERAHEAQAKALVERVPVADVELQVANANATFDPKDAAEEVSNRAVEEIGREHAAVRIRMQMAGPIKEDGE